MNAPRILSRVAFRRSCAALQCAAPRRAYGSPSFQSYPLYSNNNTPPPARGDGIPETSIATPDPLPKVNETRPPKIPSQMAPRQQSSTAQTTANTSLATSEASATSSAQTAGAVAPAPKVSEQAAQTPKPTGRPQRKLRARKAAMKLSPSAVEQLRALLDQPEPKLIKVGVRNRGCSGLAYHLEYVDKPGSFDEEVVQDGVKVLIDSKALFSIIGSEMDWVEDKLSQRFVFKNPNIKEQCGCGESFMV
ncbi:iron-sulfur cluster assembly accessory protein [Colletotrichum graminicola]|uniref:Iron-sulfur assembly protein 1 n=1 Tax=Colletotrichum graminicola (strain M1.001 / M2 / FGSC 10212) TaxID=645133 RepID=E3QWS3_COLGM|nr:iron-sulfur cluster assembly accessory protein [Colletotrichum graminicola M1.001]EFQ35311.1 iron-sulfur cluster assembly accessory protein [Colletotrichum graminicola M1.001]WDK22110.1 iron-sulfur cluster assembly accessory protein [Colletotrichum graminicola]